jgi:hypothetical protein
MIKFFSKKLGGKRTFGDPGFDERIRFKNVVSGCVLDSSGSGGWAL